MYALATATEEFLRNSWSLDYDDLIIAITAIIVAVLGTFAWRKVTTDIRSTTEVVDGGVLAQFLEMSNKVLTLQETVYSLESQYGEAVRNLHEMEKLEEFLRASLREKDAIIEDLRQRIAHLEELQGLSDEDETSKQPRKEV